jgi:hypothetical protein
VADLIAFWESHETRRAESAGRMKVTVEIDQKWVRLARSPLYYIVTTLTGASVTFAPLFLYWSGKGTFYHGHEGITVPLCFVVIYFVPGFY